MINAIQHLTPNAEHRHCARHVYGNWKKKHVGEKFMALFWECVKACTTAQFQRKLEELRIESQKAHDDFCARNPKSFCKSLLCSNTKSDATDNNISEAFNSFILSARDKPILHMLEEIRKSVMVKIHEFSNAVKKSQDVICPAVRKRLYKIDGQARYCRITASIHDKYEVTLFGETHVVNLNARACSCRDWELTGIPCSHACACINYSRLDVVDFVDSFFYKKTWEETYAHGLEPLRGEIEWPKITENPIMPPHFTKRPGRPKKQRKRSQDEVRKSNPSKLTRHGIRMKCTNCGELGHNRRSCQKNKVALLYLFSSIIDILLSCLTCLPFALSSRISIKELHPRPSRSQKDHRLVRAKEKLRLVRAKEKLHKILDYLYATLGMSSGK